MFTYREWKKSLVSKKVVNEQVAEEPVAQKQGLLTFHEWQINEGRVMSRLAMQTPEEHIGAEHAPSEGDYVYYVDPSQKRVPDVYRVFRKSNEGVVLIDQKKGRGKQASAPFIVSQKDWHGFQMVARNLLTPAERKKFGNERVWLLGPGKEQFMKNRHTTWNRRANKVTDTTPQFSTPSDAAVASMRAKLLGSNDPPAYQSNDANSLKVRVFGNDEPKSKDDLTQKIRMGWLNQDRKSQ